MIILRSALFSNKEQKRLRKQWEESLRNELEETSFLAHQDFMQSFHNLAKKKLKSKYIGDPTVNAGISIVRDYNRFGADTFYNNTHVIKNRPDELEFKAKRSIEDLKRARQSDLTAYRRTKQSAQKFGGNLPLSYSANPNPYEAGLRKGVAEYLAAKESLAAEQSLARKEKAKELRENNKLRIAIRDAKRYIKK